MLLVEELILEDEQVDNSARDIGVGDIEYSAEEVAIMTHKEAEEVGGVLPLEERQMYHVDNPACEEACALLLDKEAIEGTVDHIAYGTGEDKHRTDNNTLRHLRALVDKVAYAVDKSANHHHTEEAQHNLAAIAAELHAEGEAWILDIAEVEPWKDLYRLAHMKMGVHEDFHHLVEGDKQRGPYSYLMPHGEARTTQRLKHTILNIVRWPRAYPRKTNKFATNIQKLKKIYYFCATIIGPGGEMVDALVSGASA